MEGVALGLVAALAWGVHDLLVQYVSRTVGIAQSIFSVLFFGLIAHSIFAIGTTESIQISTEALIYSILAGVAFFAACIGHYNAFAKGPVRIVAPLIGTYSVLAFLVAAFTGQSISVFQWIAVLTLIGGIALIARPAKNVTQEETEYNLREIIAYSLLAMFGFAATFAIGQKASTLADPTLTGIVTRVAATVLIGLVLIASMKQRKGLFSAWKSKSVLILISMGVLDALALSAVFSAGTVDRPEFASATSSTFGLVTVLLAWLFFKESIARIQWMGILLIFASIFYLSAT